MKKTIYAILMNKQKRSARAVKASLDQNLVVGIGWWSDKPLDLGL